MARLYELLAENKLNAGKGEEAENLRKKAEALRREGPADSPLLIRVQLRTGRLREAREALEDLAAIEMTEPVHKPRAHRETLLLLSIIYAMVHSAVTAALAGSLHALFLPIIRPGVTGSEFTVAALLMVLMGGIGTLSGAVIGAATLKLLSFFFERSLGKFLQVLIGVIYILIVLFFPHGVVGTWRLRWLEIKQGRKRLIDYLRRGLGMEQGPEA